MSTTQILPQHYYPHQVVQINDNTVRTRVVASNAPADTSMLFVFHSPKGRDGKVQTITQGLTEFENEYGLGAFSVYGQPLLNAYIAATVNDAELHCLRVTATDAAYSTLTVMARYKVNDTADGLEVKFFGKYSDAPVTDLSQLDLATTAPVDPDADGYTHVKLFTVAYLGKGSYGTSVKFKIASDKNADKLNAYKNYTITILTSDNGGSATEQERFAFSLDVDSIYGGTSLFLDDVISDPETGSDIITTYTDLDGFKAIYDAYKAVQPDTLFTMSDFDFLTGIDRYVPTQAIVGYDILPADEGPVGSATDAPITLTNAFGNALTGGSDGNFDPTLPDYHANVQAQYLRAFDGEIDPLIVSENRFPTTFIMDANFDVDVKAAIVRLAEKRQDCTAMLDCGLSITKATTKSWIDTNLGPVANGRTTFIEPYAMKVRDPYSQKAVTVTSTYWLSMRYPQHIDLYNGKHIPLAGNAYGEIEGYIPNSIYPVFEPGLDSDLMDELAEAHINFAKYNPSQIVVRAMQDSRQEYTSNLSEQSNVLILLDIRRDAIRLASQYEYNFSEDTDIARFNTSLSTLVNKYAFAQVKSITAAFSRNVWEGQNNIIHLNIALQNKRLIRDTIIEIDINPIED